MPRVVALDPGEKVGIAHARMSRGELEAPERLILPLEHAADWLWRYQLHPPRAFDVIVYETWVPRPRDGSMAWIQGDPLLSAQFVGMVRLIARRSSSRLKTYGPDRKRAWEGWIKTVLPDAKHSSATHDDDHDWDALLHLVGYYAENWWRPPNEG
jgi:hypothetical protein